jgi:hypothetical protein
VGSGFRTFTAGEVLTASNVQNYLMDQSVMVFGGSAARSSAIGTANFEEGMVSYLTDTDKVEAYNGTNWVSVAPTTSQGLTLINTTSFSGVASQSFNNVFSATYDNYRVIFSRATCSTAASDVRLRLRVGGVDNSTASSYIRRGFYADGSTISNSPASETSQNLVMYLSTSANQDSHSIIDFTSPFIATRTGYAFMSFSGNAEAGAGMTGYHTQTVSYDGFSLFTNTGNNFAGTIQVFGYNK